MNRIGIFVIMAFIVLSGCGRENSCSVVTKSCGTISPEEVGGAVADSTAGVDENCAIIPSVGGQLLKLAYVEYSLRGGTQSELAQLPTSQFALNLARLYRDVRAAVE